MDANIAVLRRVLEMKIWQVILFAILQGITEFLPVSSSGHLVLLKNLLGLETTVSVSFDVMLHVGTLFAVFVCYWKDIKRLIVEGIGIIVDSCYNIGVYFNNKKILSASQKDGVDWELKEYRRVIKSAYRKFALLVIVSSIPTAILGVIERKLIEDRVVTSALIPGIFLLITGLLLLLIDRLDEGDKTPKRTSYLDAVLVGIAQGIGTLPGISRSGSTITAGIAVGMKREFAIKYSFIMSIPAIIGAALFEIGDMRSEHLTRLDLRNYAIGMVVSAIVGFICIKLLIAIIKEKKMFCFTYYCFAIGSIAIISSIIL